MSYYFEKQELVREIYSAVKAAQEIGTGKKQAVELLSASLRAGNADKIASAIELLVRLNVQDMKLSLK